MLEFAQQLLEPFEGSGPRFEYLFDHFPYALAFFFWQPYCELFSIK
jgi:hypothetical protein